MRDVCKIIMESLERNTWEDLQVDGKMKNGVFWDVAPCGSCKNRYFGGI
jgi:hypothetical protein